MKVLKNLLITIGVILLIAIPFFFFNPYLFVKYNSLSTPSSAESLNNPYQGFYRIYGFLLSDKNAEAKKIKEVLNEPSDQSILLIEINLQNYSNRKLSKKALSQLEQIFTHFSKQNKQLIVRFLYDWNGYAAKTEPKKMNTIFSHMDQVAPVINKHKDSIYLLQGLFIGNWGEIGGSKYSDYSSIKKLLKYYAKVTDSSIYLSVRTPSQWRFATNRMDLPKNFPMFQGYSLDKQTTDSNVFMSRLGLFNDGMMGSESDLGTYGSTKRSKAKDPSYNGTRSEELKFQNNLCKTVPNGGEVVYDTKYNDLKNAIPTLYQMHVSYLNDYYDANVINKWKNSTYTGNDEFNNHSGYDYIKNHLGYRYQIENSSLSYENYITKTAKLDITLKNTGFSSAFRDFTMQVTIKGIDNELEKSYALSGDLKKLWSNSSKKYTLQLPVKDYPNGNYQIYFNVTDKTTKKTIFLANTNEHTSFGYQIGELTMDGFLRQ